MYYLSFKDDLDEGPEDEADDEDAELDNEADAVCKDFLNKIP